MKKANLTELFILGKYSTENFTPWLVPEAIAFIEEHINADVEVFEYGSGGSTIWFSERARSVTTVDHSVKWYKWLKKQISSKEIENISPHLSIKRDEYVKFINKTKKMYDIILVDGLEVFRNACVRASYNRISKGGLFIVDNTNRKSSMDGNLFLDRLGWNRIDFVADDHPLLKNNRWTTSVWIAS